MLWFKEKTRACGVMLSLSAALLAGCGGGSTTDSTTEGHATISSLGSLSNHIITSSGVLTGNPADASGILSFKGVPYAQAPVGNLRWKAPQAINDWVTPRNATQIGAQCWGASVFGGPIPTANKSEDCLNLNVWTGAKTVAARLPVMVWLHGGGFQFGAGSDPRNDGTSLAKKGVVVVTLNYRLGVFGFLSRPDLDAESFGQKSGMYGMLDQIAALNWVRTNIALFGGDPSNITVFGESAGAHAVGLLQASPLAAGLFQKAIGESGAFWESEMKPRNVAQASGVALGTKLSATTLAQLRAVPALQLQTATDWTANVPTVFSPTVDGYVLPELPYLRFKNGRQNNVAVLAGWNAAEGALFMPYSLPHGTPQAFIDAATAKFGAANMPKFLQLYPASSEAQATQSAQTLVGDLTISQQTWEWATLQRKTGYSPTYVYNFSFTSAYTPLATHTTEIAYVFGNFLPTPQVHPAVAPSAQDLALSNAMQSYWTNFARTGNPNGTGLPAWPQYNGAGSQALQLATAATQAGPEEGTARFQFLDMFRGADGLIPVGQH